MFQQFMTFMEPYWLSVGVFIFVYSILEHFEDLIGLRGIWKLLVTIICTVLFYHFGDDVGQKFTDWMRFLGLQPVQPGLYK